MHKPWFEILFEVARITYVYWAIECTSKLWFEVLFKLVRIADMYWAIECTPKFWFEVLFEVTRITYVYWPIECTLKPWFETLFEVARITYCLLVNWMYFKTFICQGVPTCKNYPCILVDSMHSKPSFHKVFRLMKITYIS